MQKLLVVDGSNLLFQMFYGMPARIFNKDGKPIHGTLGFVGALLKIIRMTQPTHAVVLFDGACHNERVDVDAAYKANRPDFSEMAEEETPFSQLPDIYAALDFLQIKRMETTVCETDDIVAAYAFRYGKEHKIVISSFDSDFFQLVDENVSIFRYRGDKSILCDVAYIQEKYAVSPSQYADFKALTGDNADNIKGVRGVGNKTAADLIRTFGNLKNLLENVENIRRESVRKAVEEARERIKINSRLIKLENRAEIPFEMEYLQFADGGVSTSEVLHAIGLK